ncbi:MAG: hypothetical protein ABI249_00785, partial [Ornithinibacter sp.]
MTLAPTRPDAFTPAERAGVAAPSVTAMLLSRGDPLGMGELLEAVLGQALPPDEVLVLNRTDAGPAPRVPAPGDGGRLDTGDARDPDTDDASGSDDADADTGAQADDARTPASESTSSERAETAEQAETPEQAAVGEPEPASGLAAIVEAVASTRRIPVTVRTVDPRTPVRVAIRDAVLEREPDPELPGE